MDRGPLVASVATRTCRVCAKPFAAHRVPAPCDAFTVQRFASRTRLGSVIATAVVVRDPDATNPTPWIAARARGAVWTDSAAFATQTDAQAMLADYISAILARPTPPLGFDPRDRRTYTECDTHGTAPVDPVGGGCAFCANARTRAELAR